MKGEVVFYRLFDLGASVDLDEIQGTVDMPFLAGRMLSERATPKYARFAAPLLIYVDQRTLETNVGSLVASIAVKLYGVGALAVVVRTPFERAPSGTSGHSRASESGPPTRRKPWTRTVDASSRGSSRTSCRSSMTRTRSTSIRSRTPCTACP